MRVVIQRVAKAYVLVESVCVGQINKGLCILLGVMQSDTIAEADYLVKKIVDLRIFSDGHGKMNFSLRECEGAVLVVSQFTLYANCSKGRRPSFIEAAPPEKGKELYEYFVDQMKRYIPQVETGQFGAEMLVHLINDGPVTIILNSSEH